MGKINVDSIKTNLLREAAQEADKNGDKYLDEAEISIFENSVDLSKLKNLSQKAEYDNIVKDARKDTNYNEAIQTGYKEHVYTKATAGTSNIDDLKIKEYIYEYGFDSREKLMTAIDFDKSKMDDNSPFKQPNAQIAIDAIKDVINAVRLDSIAVDSYKDIKKAYKEAAEKLPDDIEHRRALEIVKDLTMVERKNYILGELSKEYNPEEIVKTGRLDDKADEVAEKYKNNDDFSKEFRAFRKQQDKDFAKKVYMDILMEVTNEAYKNTEELAEGVDRVKEVNRLKIDRAAYKRAMKIARETGNKELAKFAENSDDAWNEIGITTDKINVEANRFKTAEEYMRELSYTGNVDGKMGYVLTDDKKELMAMLQNKGLVKVVESTAENEDDSKVVLDLTTLSDVIGVQLGINNRLDKTRRDMKELSELQGLVSELRAQTDISTDKPKVKISEKTAKELAELCGYNVSSISWKKFLEALAALGIAVVATSAAGAAAGALAGAAVNPPIGRFDEKLQHTLTIPIIDGKDATIGDIGKDLQSVVSKEVVGNDLIITIDTNIFLPDEFVYATECFGATAFGAALGALLPLLIGEAGTEIPAINPDVDTTCLKDYVKTVYNRTNNKDAALILSAIALDFYDEKTDKFDVQGLKDFITVLKGENSVLNKDELLAYIMDKNNPQIQRRLAQFRADRDANCSDADPTPVDDEPFVNDPEPVVEEVIATATETKVKEVEKFNANASDWDTLLALYPCFNDDPEISKLSKSDKKRLLKLAQAIKDGNYSKERMLDLLKYKDTENAKHVEHLKSLEYFDYDVYYNQVWATYFENEANMVLPKEFAGCERPDIEINNNDSGREFLRTKTKHTTSNRANKGSTTVQVEKKNYLVKYLDNEGREVEESYSDMAQRDHRVEEVITQKLGTKVQKVTVREWENVEDFKNDDLK